MVKVCHMTSAHGEEDVRIFHKECVSLANAGYDVYLVECGESREKNGVHIVGVGEIPKSRRKRMTEGAKKVYEAARAVNADIYHFHDPELLPYGMKLKRAGKKVIFDSHEDYLSTITEKTYIPSYLRKIISWGYGKYEKYVCSHFSGVIACYHWTQDRLTSVCPNMCLIFNFPIIYSALTAPDYSSRKVCFAGGISAQYNLDTAIKAISCVEGAGLLLAGDQNTEMYRTLVDLPEWRCVDFQGQLPHRELPERVYQKSSAGIVLLDYIAQCHGHVGNLSNIKLFEVMAQGLPVVCTDFQLWKEVIDEYACGICVDPHDVSQIETALRTLLCNPDVAKQMGQNARRAVEEKYNWASEEKKLLALYEKIATDK